MLAARVWGHSVLVCVCACPHKGLMCSLTCSYFSHLLLLLLYAAHSMCKGHRADGECWVASVCWQRESGDILLVCICACPHKGLMRTNCYSKQGMLPSFLCDSNVMNVFRFCNCLWLRMYNVNSLQPALCSSVAACQ